MIAERYPFLLKMHVNKLYLWLCSDDGYYGSCWTVFSLLRAWDELERRFLVISLTKMKKLYPVCLNCSQCSFVFVNTLYKREYNFCCFILMFTFHPVLARTSSIRHRSGLNLYLLFHSPLTFYSIWDIFFVVFQALNIFYLPRKRWIKCISVEWNILSVHCWWAFET